MDIRETIKSQYHATLEMMRTTITKCPVPLWEQAAPTNDFWRVAYHTLFFTHLYLQPSEADFVPWEKHRAESHFLGPLPWPPHREPEIGEPYSQAEVLEYLEFVASQIDAAVDSLDLSGESGFEWLPFDKLELQLYNIRHLQHHVGELGDRLGTQAGIDIDWVGLRPQ
ncbi:MAG: DinB family protein [Chloroflexota bacterium]|nr:DinB family protein [Chloroflexota bacterium]